MRRTDENVKLFSVKDLVPLMEGERFLYTKQNLSSDSKNFKNQEYNTISKEVKRRFDFV